MDWNAFVIGLFRYLGLTALVIMAYAKAIQVTDGKVRRGLIIGLLFGVAGVLSMSEDKPICFVLFTTQL